MEADGSVQQDGTLLRNRLEASRSPYVRILTGTFLHVL